MKILGTALSIVVCVVLNIAAHAQWTTSSNDIYNSNSGNVGIGNTAPATKLHVTTGSGVVGIRVTQGSSPTVAPFQIEDASGAKLVSVTKEGFLSVIRPGGSFPSTPNALLDLQTDSDDLIRGYNTGTTGSVFRVTAGGAIYCNSNNIYDPGNNRLHASSLVTTSFIFAPDIAASNGGGLDLRLNRDHYGVANVLIGFNETQNSGVRLQVKGKGYFSGDVGIGTVSPQGKLHLYGLNPGIIIEGDVNSYYSYISLKSQAGSGHIDNYGFITPASGGLNFQTKSYNDKLIGLSTNPTGNHAITYDPTITALHVIGAYQQTADIFTVSQNLATSHVTGVKVFSVSKDGNVNIGASAIPTGYKLAVGGDIIAEKIKIKLQTGWPDYVFQRNYALPSLKEVEEFIRKNNHLPGVPSAAEIKEEGLDLGDGQAMLLKKIEEMTLYIIDLSKKVEKLEAENERMKTESKRK